MTRQIHQRANRRYPVDLDVADCLRLGRTVSVRLDDARPDSAECLGLSGKETDYRVNGSSRAPYRAMRDILRRDRSVLRHMPCRAHRPRLNAANANSER